MEIGWTVGTLAFLLVFVGLIYAFYLRILIVASAGVSVLFGAAWSVGLTTLLFPTPFERTSTVLVERTGLPDFLREVDTRIEAIEQLPRVVWEKLKSPFGVTPPEIEATPAVREAGALETALVPAVVRGVSLVLRGVAFAISALIMLVALSLRSATASVGELRALRHRIESLEAETAERAGPG